MRDAIQTFQPLFIPGIAHVLPSLWQKTFSSSALTTSQPHSTISFWSSSYKSVYIRKLRLFLNELPVWVLEPHGKLFQSDPPHTGQTLRSAEAPDGGSLDLMCCVWQRGGGAGWMFALTSSQTKVDFHPNLMPPLLRAPKLLENNLAAGWSETGGRCCSFFKAPDSFSFNEEFTCSFRHLSVQIPLRREKQQNDTNCSFTSLLKTQSCRVTL